MSITNYFRTKYNRLTEATEHLYNRALQLAGLPDCAEMRIAAAVTTSVILYYLLIAVSVIISQFQSATESLTALVTIAH